MAYFTVSTFTFLRRLAAHNDADWFAANTTDYRSHVRQPAAQFVTDVASPLSGISSHLDIDRASVFHIRRDGRFAEEPYKTYTGFYVRHAAVPGIQSPGFYLRIEPRNCFLSAGAWRPPAPAASAIRRAIAARPAEWAAVIEPFGDWEKQGQSLRRLPAGFDNRLTDGLVADIRRRDFTYRLRFTQRQVVAPGFLDEFIRGCRAASPFLGFICSAAGLAW